MIGWKAILDKHTQPEYDCSVLSVVDKFILKIVTSNISGGRNDFSS